MGKTLIRVDCVDQRLYYAAAPAVASGGKNENVIEFNFCHLWDGFAKTAIFYRSEDTVYHVAIPDDRCIIPHEVLAEEGVMYFGVFGVKDDITRTSEVMRYRVRKGAITEGVEPSDPTPDIYTQILSQYADLNTRVTRLEAGGGSGGSGGLVEELDPTVPAWAKEATKPAYTAAEVGAIADKSGVLASKHYGNNSINSTKLADDAIWPRHISDLAWNEIDSHINTAIEGNVNPSTPGESGEDGGYYTPSVSADGTLSWTASKSDMPTIASANIRGPKGDKGDTGSAGAAGSDGVGIKSVTQTTTSSADGGSNVITVTKTDNTTSTFTVKNGSKGSKGDTGPTGPAGYTPVKGVDYFTDADQEAIVQQVIAAMGTPVFGTVNDDNNIILSGNLAEGAYTLKYEDADGNLTVIGAIEIGAEPAYTNILDTVGWQENKRISASSGYSEKDNTGTDLTGYIAVKTGDVIRLKNVTMPQTSTDYDNQLYYYDSGKSGKGSTSLAPPNYDSVADGAGNIIQFKVGSAWTPGGTGFIRIGAANIDSTSIITINEVIE